MILSENGTKTSLQYEKEFIYIIRPLVLYDSVCANPSKGQAEGASNPFYGTGTLGFDAVHLYAQRNAACNGSLRADFLNDFRRIKMLFDAILSVDENGIFYFLKC